MDIILPGGHTGDMARIVGMDEVGYGPLLGPFIVCAVTAEVPSLEANLWETLSPKEIPVCDSKKLYSTSKGLKSLEPSALSWYGQLYPLEGLTHERLWKTLSPDPREEAWYGNIPLPVSQKRPILVDELKALLETANVRITDIRARILEPSIYNEKVGTNKSDLLFTCTADLVRHAFKKENRPTTFHIGKQGGRRYYLPQITQQLGEAKIIREEAAWSEYTLGESSLCYLRDGEDISFFIALASIIAKYLRETSMQLFNRYWEEKVENLRPTAGYGNDAKRFWKEISPRMGELKLTEKEILRSR